MSVCGNTRFGSSISVIDYIQFGSSFSLRSFLRFGSSISISCTGGGGVNLRTGGSIEGGTKDAPFTINAVTATKTVKYISMASPSPTPSHVNALHGFWIADHGVDDSDRRLKQNVVPLESTLKDARHKQKRGRLLPRDASREDSKLEEESAVSWVLRELRPVSFRFKSQFDAKAMPSENRYGFIAQEVKKVMPALVSGGEEGSSSSGTLAIVYQDFLAVITAAIQEQQRQLNRDRDDVSQAQLEVQELLDAADTLERVLDSFEAASPPTPPTLDADKRS